MNSDFVRPVFGSPAVFHFAYLEEDLHSIDEEKDDNDEHEEGVAAVEDVGVELTLLMFYPDLKSIVFIKTDLYFLGTVSGISEENLGYGSFINDFT